MREPSYKRLPPHVFEPEHLWGALATLALNICTLAPYLVLFAWLALACSDGPFSERQLLAPPDAAPHLWDGAR